MQNIKIMVWVILGICVFMSGFIVGASYTVNKGIDVAEQMLDVKLSAKAESILLHNPHLIRFIFEQNYTYTDNPFIDHPQGKVHWEYCMVMNNDKEFCDNLIINKYGLMGSGGHWDDENSTSESGRVIVFSSGQTNK